MNDVQPQSPLRSHPPIWCPGKAPSSTSIEHPSPPLSHPPAQPRARAGSHAQHITTRRIIIICRMQTSNANFYFAELLKAVGQAAGREISSTSFDQRQAALQGISSLPQAAQVSSKGLQSCKEKSLNSILSDWPGDKFGKRLNCSTHFFFLVKSKAFTVTGVGSWFLITPWEKQLGCERHTTLHDQVVPLLKWNSSLCSRTGTVSTAKKWQFGTEYFYNKMRSITLLQKINWKLFFFKTN